MEVFNTLKRSISATASGMSRQSTSSSGQPNGASGGHWMHPPDSLINGRVEYAVKMLGQTEVQEAKGTNIVREAIHVIRFHLQVKRGETGHSGAKLRKVILQISIYGVNVIDAKSRAILFKHPLYKISFCADDKQDKRLFSYIAKNDSGKHQCFVFLSDKMAENITLTIGEAFDLAYEKFIKKKGRDLENQRQQLLLRKRVVELEEENRKLKHLLAGCTCKANSDLLISVSLDAFSIPPDRIFHGFNGGSSDSDANLSPKVPPPPPPLPLAPPPRRANGQPNSGVLLAEVFENERSIQPANLSELFDDEFDPRASEKKAAENRDGIEAGAQRNTVADFEALLFRVDKQLAEVQNNLGEWNLERGDTGDSGRDWTVEGEEQQKDRPGDLFHSSETGN